MPDFSCRFEPDGTLESRKDEGRKQEELKVKTLNIFSVPKFSLFQSVNVAVLAQLGERQTEATSK